MLPAKDIVPIEDDLISVLEHVPGTKAQKQQYFLTRGIRVPRTNYEALWDALTARLHRSGAASAVFELLREGGLTGKGPGSALRGNLRQEGEPLCDVHITALRAQSVAPVRASACSSTRACGKARIHPPNSAR